MHLKRLEIQGFKSFADKVVLEMKPGIILVVGPNGSGKSNIADAIRWVLGEQSAKSLRGGKMEDVIFAGSDKRRSLGMAEVSLTIDNASGLFPLEFNEITVTRRLYRSGESDYLINRVPCRLRDIHELFMDTGVGREGISLIGQGKIEEILSMKPEERRSILEDAAGIIKYRHRKRETVRKLEDTELSLVRLSDIISELSEQETPLAEQARIAALYQGLKRELDSLEIGLIIDELDNAAKRLRNIKNSRSQEETEIEAVRAKYLDAQSREEELKLELQKLEELHTHHQERVYSLNLALEKSEGEKNLVDAKITELNRQRENIDKEIEAFNSEYLLVKSEHESHKSGGDALNKLIQEKKAALKEFEELLEEQNWHNQKMSEQLEALRSEHFDALQEEAKLNNEQNSQKQKIGILERQEEQLLLKEKSSKAELEKVTGLAADLAREAEELEDLVRVLETSIIETEDKLLAQEKILRAIEQENKAVQQERNSILAKEKALTELEKEGQGYGEGVRELLRLKEQEQISGIIGTVAQVITVPKKYELAVEVALGGALQHLLAENDKVAQEAIQWLKKNNKGRVTLLPLNTVKGHGAGNKIPAGPGVIGRLSELIRYEDRFDGVLEYLLGRVWLVENLQTAVKQAKATDFRYRIVTMDGQIVNAGGSITGGGTRPNPSGILSRRRNIYELRQALSKLDEKMAQGEIAQEKAAQAHTAYKQEIGLINQKIQEASIKKAENSKAKERWQAESSRLTAELETIGWQLKELVNEREGLQRSIRRYAEETILLKERINNSVQSIQDMTERVKIYRAESIKKNEKLTLLRIEAATVEEKMASFKKEELHYTQRLTQLTQQKQERESRLVQLAGQKEELESSYASMESLQEQQALQLQEMGQELEVLKKNKQLISEQISQISQDVKVHGSQLRDKEEKLHQYDLQESKYEMISEAAERRLSEQFEISTQLAREKYQAVTERKLSQQRISALKEEISLLGQVNTGAIEEYNRLKERLDFLRAQVADMYEAKERLQEVIHEMDRIMTRRFKETFVQVDIHFQEMFSRLFGGGRAQLILTEPDNLLETGVDIIAQPPGKKTQYLSLLSGGEKALTAISLLMAILKYKPSPFCVLDEIESNLDEANVLRFAELLKEFAEHTQFIVISHHKGTMEAGHILYGVTIEENGVSRLVSVKLEDAQKEAS